MLNLEERTKKHFNKSLKESSEQELYKVLLDLVEEKSAEMPTNESKRKMYYVSSEFLIGKLLSNNLLNLGIYNDVKEGRYHLRMSPGGIVLKTASCTATPMTASIRGEPWIATSGTPSCMAAASRPGQNRAKPQPCVSHHP